MSEIGWWDGLMVSAMAERGSSAGEAFTAARRVPRALQNARENRYLFASCRTRRGM